MYIYIYIYIHIYIYIYIYLYVLTKHCHYFAICKFNAVSFAAGEDRSFCVFVYFFCLLVVQSIYACCCFLFLVHKQVNREGSCGKVLRLRVGKVGNETSYEHRNGTIKLQRSPAPANPGRVSWAPAIANCRRFRCRRRTLEPTADAGTMGLQHFPPADVGGGSMGIWEVLRL